METIGPFAEIAAAAERAACLSSEDYRDRDGIWHCHICHAPKQTVIRWPGIPEPVTVYCICKCGRDRWHQDKVDREQQERQNDLRRLSMSDMETAASAVMTLDADDGKSPFVTQLARKYTENWDMMMASGKGGLVFWGNPGTGKTFFATAIGNELMRRGVTVAKIAAAKVVEASQGLYDYEKSNYVSTLNRHDCLILDDIGAERNTAFAREIIFSLIDDRCSKGLPTLATTNMTPDQMRDPKDSYGNPDMGYKRIFDRLLGVSTLVQLSGESRRMESGREAREIVKGVFNS